METLARYALCLAVAVLVNAPGMLVGQQIINPYRYAGGGGGLASFSDDFNRANSTSLGSNWTEADTDIEILSNTLSLIDSADFTQKVAIYSATACATVNQYIKSTITLGVPGAIFPSFYFRYTNSSSAFYEIRVDRANGWIRWYHWTAIGGTSTELTSIEPWTYANGTVGIAVSGTGTSTVVRFWGSVTANAPDTGGTTWDSNAATVTITVDPSVAVNSGAYLGLGGINNSGTVTHDNFYGGDIP